MNKGDSPLSRRPLKRPKPLVEMAISAYEAEHITLARFAEMMGMSRSEAVDFLEEAGVNLRILDEEDIADELDLA